MEHHSDAEALALLAQRRIRRHPAAADAKTKYRSAWQPFLIRQVCPSRKEATPAKRKETSA
jgi:hypothetical protein